MSGVPGLLAALCLPWLLGWGWARRLCPPGAHPASVLGHAYLLGVLLTTLLLWLWGRAGLPWRFPWLLLLFAALAAFAWRPFPRPAPPAVALHSAVFSAPWQRGLWWLLLALLAVRHGGLLLEVIWRPLFPWDATMNWAPRAKVWFELGRMIPFTDLQQWPREAFQGPVYTLVNADTAHYPPLVPLIQLWTALGLGQWRDNWINLPWWLCALALLLAFYGQLRNLAIAPLAAMAATWLLGTLPLLNVHVALAGYADLWLAAFYAAAVMAQVDWNLTGSRRSLWLMALLAGACMFTKKPGLAWAFTLLPGLLLGLTPTERRHWLLAWFAALFAAWWLVGGFDLRLPGGIRLLVTPAEIDLPGLGRHHLEFHPVARYFADNLLLMDNWHLLGWLLLGSTPLLLWRSLQAPACLPLAATLFSGALFLGLVFFYTENYRYAVDSTTLNRALLHALPAWLYVSAVVFLQHWNKGVAKKPTGAGPNAQFL